MSDLTVSCCGNSGDDLKAASEGDRLVEELAGLDAMVKAAEYAVEGVA
jgi:hypothetical protein